MSTADDGMEDKAQLAGDTPGPPPPYRPPSQFKEISTLPLLPESLPANVELWLVRIQDNRLKADEFKEKQVKLTLNASDGKMGCFEDSNGSPFEILDLHSVTRMKPFAFLPRGDSSLEIKRVSRQVAIVQRPKPVTLRKPSSALSQPAPLEIDGKSIVKHSQKREDVLSIPNESSRGTGLSQVIQESHGGSSMRGGDTSAIESMQRQEENFKPVKPSKRSKRAQPNLNLEDELSPLASPRHNSDANDLLSLKKESRKHRKTKQQESA